MGIPSNLYHTTNRHIHSLPTLRSAIHLRNGYQSHFHSPLPLLSRRNVFVQIAQTPNPLSLKFIPTGYNILPSSEDGASNPTLDMSSYKEAMNKSALAREL